VTESQIQLDVRVEEPGRAEWADEWWRFLTEPPGLVADPVGRLRVLDLFSGIGGLAIGFGKAAAERGYVTDSIGAVDLDERALSVYAANLGTRHPRRASVRSLVDFQVRGEGTSARFLYEPELVGDAEDEFAGGIDVILAGPPCQGHSTLNNKTRGNDPRNSLYLTVPALAVAIGARIVIVENVPGVVRSKGNVVESAIALLHDAGYAITSTKLAADRLGWPQTRQRFFLVATRPGPPVTLAEVARDLGREALPVSWAIGDLLDVQCEVADPMNSTAELSPENAARIEWLFANDEYDTPNHLRPDCHKEGTTYTAVYGRMRWDRPAPTLTTGYLTPGRGRFVHPKLPRTITPREAARIQGFPDWFDFSPVPDGVPHRRELGAWIGNAVPPILGYAAGTSALGDGRPDGPAANLT
jgi:DNA (cytosine-5)-methyltransferase 1